MRDSKHIPDAHSAFEGASSREGGSHRFISTVPWLAVQQGCQFSFICLVLFYRTVSKMLQCTKTVLGCLAQFPKMANAVKLKKILKILSRKKNPQTVVRKKKNSSVGRTLWRNWAIVGEPICYWLALSKFIECSRTRGDLCVYQAAT